MKNNDEYIEKLCLFLSSEEGKLAKKLAEQNSRKMLAEIEQRNKIKDPLFWFKRVTI